MMCSLPVTYIPQTNKYLSMVPRVCTLDSIVATRLLVCSQLHCDVCITTKPRIDNM